MCVMTLSVAPELMARSILISIRENSHVARKRRALLSMQLTMLPKQFLLFDTDSVHSQLTNYSAWDVPKTQLAPRTMPYFHAWIISESGRGCVLGFAYFTTDMLEVELILVSVIVAKLIYFAFMEQ